MAEYIDREVAINAIKKDIMGGLNYESILERIPSADVQPVKHGRWQENRHSDNVMVCSVCGVVRENGNFKYCPNCGARMDGET